MSLKNIFLTFFLLLPQSLYCITSSYVSTEDEDITLQTLVVSNGKDNVQGIYSKPISEFLKTMVEHEHFIEVNDFNNENNLDLNELRSNSKLVTDLITKNKSDGLLHLQIAKGPMGLLIELGLFTKKSGLIWAYAENLVKDKFDLDNVKQVTTNLFSQLMNQIPYQGLIVSRTGNRVTVNRGFLSQIKTDQDIDVIQIVGVKRHPQFQFITNVQKEIIGKIRIMKIDEKISFGYILFEKEPHVVQSGLKVLIKEPTYYSNLATSKNEDVVDHLLSRPDGQIILKGESKEWLPVETPGFGRVHVFFGLGQFFSSTHLTTEGGQQGSTLLAFNAQVDTDLWITRAWFVRAGLNQGSAQINNPLSGSSPAKINYSLQGLKLAMGYDFEISPSIYGPRFQTLFGYSQFNSLVTESTPTAYTSTLYSGFGIGLAGFLPWYEEFSKWGFGSELWYHLLPSITETPVTSGSARQTHIIELSALANYQWRPDLSWVGKLSYDTYNTSFSGSGTRPQLTTGSDLSWLRFNVGMEYLF